jgi:hypothetical protein
VFTYATGSTHIEHLDARTTRRIAAVLETRDSPARSDSSPRRTERAGRDAGPSRRATASATGEGMLMISSKPPCEIIVDGKSTGLTTPQRAIALPAGDHRVTLINREKSIRKTLAVQIAADTTEKVIEDLMK